jgi:hypothetical protein
MALRPASATASPYPLNTKHYRSVYLHPAGKFPNSVLTGTFVLLLSCLWEVCCLDPTQTDWLAAPFEFQALGEREVVATFDRGALSSDGGMLLLRELNRSLGRPAAWPVASGTGSIPG